MPDVHCTRPVLIAESRRENPLACGSPIARKTARKGRANVKEKMCEEPPANPQEVFYECE